jgi:hypothetical protein
MDTKILTDWWVVVTIIVTITITTITFRITVFIVCKVNGMAVYGKYVTWVVVFLLLGFHFT